MNSHTRLLFSIGTCILSVILIYLVFFRFIDQNNFGLSESTSGGVVVGGNDQQVDLPAQSTSSSGSVDIYAGILGNTSTQPPTSSVDENSIEQFLSPSRTIYTSSVRMVELLGLSYMSAFQMPNSSGIMYAYISGGIDESSLRQTIQRLGGNIVAFDTENDIKTHGLRGDRIRYVNIPDVTYTIQQGKEKKLFVGLIVDVSTDDGRTNYWIVQADYAQYVLYKTRIVQHLQDIYQR